MDLQSCQLRSGKNQIGLSLNPNVSKTLLCGQHTGESLKLSAILRSALFPHPRFHPEDEAINSCFKYMLMLDPAVTGAEIEEQSVTSDSTTEGNFSF